MRLIEADAKIVAQLYDDEHEDWILKEMTVADYLSFSDIPIPFIDTVPVVRCGDCRYRVDSDKCCHPDGLLRSKDSDFCSYGEGREE